MRRETSAIMVTHDGEEAMFMADRIKVMNEGRIVQSGKPEEIYMRPKSAFVASLFGPRQPLLRQGQEGSCENPAWPFLRPKD